MRLRLVVVTIAGCLGDGLASSLAGDGSRPGLLVPPGDAQTLGQTLSYWLGDPRERERLRAAARSRRQTLSDWAQTSRELSAVLSEVAG